MTPAAARPTSSSPSIAAAPPRPSPWPISCTCRVLRTWRTSTEEEEEELLSPLAALAGSFHHRPLVGIRIAEGAFWPLDYWVSPDYETRDPTHFSCSSRFGLPR